MADLPGELRHRPWVNFGHNRSESLRFARRWGELALVVDADDRLSVDGAYDPNQFDTNVDGWVLPVVDGDLRYKRLHLFNSVADWRYEGAVHEFACLNRFSRTRDVSGMVYLRVGGGNRSRSPDRYLQDARLLLSPEGGEPSDPRSVFYLAQSFRDAGLHRLAIYWYRRRTRMEGFDQERWYARYQIAGLLRDRLADEAGAVREYRRCREERPPRIEPWVRLAEISRRRKKWRLALGYADRACLLPRSGDALFVHREDEDWRRWDERARALRGLGDKVTSSEIWRRLLPRPDLPLQARDRMARAV